MLTAADERMGKLSKLDRGLSFVLPCRIPCYSVFRANGLVGQSAATDRDTRKRRTTSTIAFLMFATQIPARHIPYRESKLRLKNVCVRNTMRFGR